MLIILKGFTSNNQQGEVIIMQRLFVKKIRISPTIQVSVVEKQFQALDYTCLWFLKIICVSLPQELVQFSNIKKMMLSCCCREKRKVF